jgi:hypothetical protein
MNRLFSCGVAVCSVLLAQPCAAQTKLAYKFKAGDKLEYVFDQKMKIAMNVNDMDINMQLDQSIEKTWQVKKVDAKGNARIRVRFQRVKMSMEGFTGVIEIDSKDDKELKDPVGKVLGEVVKALAAVDMTLTTDPQGEVSDVELSEASAKKLRDLPASDMVGNFASESTIKAMVQGGLVFPAAGVAKGKPWSRKLTLDMGFGKIVTDTAFVYEGEVERDGRKLHEISLKPKATLEPSPDAKIQVKMKSMESKGKCLFDNALGRAVEIGSDATLEMVIEVGGKTITQNIVQTTTLRLKK